MVKRNKQMILTVLAVLSLIAITVGVTYAFFNYTKEGTEDNTIKTGTITFLYTENSGVGRGVSIVDAYPLTDEVGKSQTGSDKMFDFKITSDTSEKASIGYQITARKSKDSDLDESVVNMYLTKVNGSNEEKLLFSKYSDLNQTSRINSSDYTEKTLYIGRVPANTADFEENYRLRMWIAEGTDFSGVKQEDGSIVYPHNNKKFKITVNVYADGKVVTGEDSFTISAKEVSYTNEKSKAGCTDVECSVNELYTQIVGE